MAAAFGSRMDDRLIMNYLQFCESARGRAIRHSLSAQSGAAHVTICWDQITAGQGRKVGGQWTPPPFQRHSL
ncbi:hypothetical protein AMECASPLE_017732 [Ameca splendens]|uniref:Uncharacterized protein n=1 Tax=Ameca splendens TaxID=208324 RepID=A0ABV0Z2B3_9TELE